MPHAEVKVVPNPHFYSVKEGTNIWSGPSNPQVSEKAPAGMTVYLIGLPKCSDGREYFFAEVQSPPEMRGLHVWLAKIPRQKGWI